jgi:hypothetical protein
MCFMWALFQEESIRTAMPRSSMVYVVLERVCLLQLTLWYMHEGSVLALYGRQVCRPARGSEAAASLTAQVKLFMRNEVMMNGLIARGRPPSPHRTRT